MANFPKKKKMKGGREKYMGNDRGQEMKRKKNIFFCRRPHFYYAFLFFHHEGKFGKLRGARKKNISLSLSFFSRASIDCFGHAPLSGRTIQEKESRKNHARKDLGKMICFKGEVFLEGGGKVFLTRFSHVCDDRGMHICV